VTEHFPEQYQACLSALDEIIKRENEENNMDIKYEIPRLEISSLADDRITLKLKRNEIDEKYETSSIKKSPK